VILGIDTATAATAAAVWAPDGPAVEARDDPEPGARPAHATRLLALVEEALERARAGWGDVERIAVGVGPGGFTGLRHGIATARGLAQARALPLVGVSSLEALARGAAEWEAAGGDAVAAEGGPQAAPSRGPQAGPTERGAVCEDVAPVLAVVDARRGEVFAAAWRGGERLLEPVAIAPADLAARIAAGPLAAPLAAGDGAVRFREQLERAGALVPADRSPVHRISALQVCRIGAVGEAAGRDGLVPDYRREPDAALPKPPQPR
jgi:tRNA threonylcarbamoyladenosine biosynthesis protein TsaB